jgi:hypothetical protein
MSGPHPEEVMPNRHAAKAILTGILICCAACDSPITPEELGAAQALVSVEGMSDRELLLAVLAKLDAFEARFERERAEMHARLDSLETPGGVLFAAMAPANVNMSDKVDSIYRRTRMTDSIMDLASFIAEDVGRPFQGFEVCGQLDLKLAELEFKHRSEGKAEAQGGVGVKPWDTGGLAQVTLGQRVELGLGVGVELGAGAEACWDLTDIGSDPPIRAMPAPMMARADAPQQLEATFMALRDQFGLNDQTLAQALGTGSAVFASGDLTGLGQLAISLNVPTAFRDPLGHVRGRLASFDAVGMLCSGTNFGPRLATVVSQGCGFIQSNDLPELGTFLNLGRNFSTLQTSFGSLSSNFTTLSGNFSTLNNKFGGVCSRMNTMLDRQVSVPIPLGDPVDVRLFPPSWAVAC